MSEDKKRQQWADHMRDEAAAIDRQQQRAGSTHEPQEGPLPFSHNDIQQAGVVAGADVRAQCIAVAAAFADEALLRREFPDWGPAQLQAAAQLAVRIAQAMRDTDAPGAAPAP